MGGATKIGRRVRVAFVHFIQRKYCTLFWYSNSKVIAHIPVTPLLRWMWKWDFLIAPSPEIKINKNISKKKFSRPFVPHESILDSDGLQHFHLHPSIPFQYRKRSYLRASSAKSSCSHLPLSPQNQILRDLRTLPPLLSLLRALSLPATKPIFISRSVSLHETLIDPGPSFPPVP